MSSLQVNKDALTAEQVALIETAAIAHGIAVKQSDEAVTLTQLSPTQVSQLAYGFQESWGLPFKGVRCIPVDSTD